jgi:DNA primase large subunit
MELAFENPDNQDVSPVDSYFSLNMYDQPVVSDLPISSICLIAEERIRALKKIQRFFEHRKEDDDRKLKFYDALVENFQSILVSTKIFNNPLFDVVSHWILKLTFTNYPAEEQFFHFYEKILFAARLYHLASLETKNLPDSEKDMRRNRFFFQHLCSYAGKSLDELTEVDNYTKNKDGEYVKVKEPSIPVPFRFAMKALESYDADLRNGKAIITPYTSFIVLQDLYEEVLQIHKKNLLKVSGFMFKMDPRLSDIVQSLRDFKTTLDAVNEVYYDKKEKFMGISYENINAVATVHFPICMLEIHDNFKQVHSLKHWGRLQYGMFLKGLGMDIKDTVRLFTNELKKSAQGEKKVKEYQYYIEHMYGKQGKKTDYTPWSCQKIAGKAIPSGNETYGCPFKFYSNKALAQTLQKKKHLSDEDIEEILEQRKVDFSLGCRKLFEKTHPNAYLSKGIGRHPNVYFSSSYWHQHRQKERTHFQNLTAPDTSRKGMEIEQDQNR